MKKATTRFLVLAALTFSTAAFSAENEVTIYSVYEAARLDPVFKPFTDRTGIKVNIVSGTSAELIAKLKSEGESTSADLHLDKDLVFHGQAQAQGLYQPFNSKIVEKNILPSLIEANKNWFTIVYRVRGIIYNTNKVSASDLSTYADLGSEKWKGRLCVRTSNNSYNEALGAFFVTHYGAEATLNLLKSWVNNLAVDPIKGDTDVINAVAAGTCDVGIANSYYLAPFVKADANYPVKFFFPNQETTGSHVNGVGIGLVKHAKNTDAATLVMEYLSSKEVQAPVASIFSQYPANPAAELAPVLTGFGKFSQDNTNVGNISAKVEESKQLLKAANYK